MKREIVRQLRRGQTMAEQKMWWHLRSRAFAGYKFCRQFLIGPFVADFCCRSRKSIVELDGGHHAETEDYDNLRTIYLEQRVLRALRDRPALPSPGTGEGGRRPDEG